MGRRAADINRNRLVFFGWRSARAPGDMKVGPLGLHPSAAFLTHHNPKHWFARAGETWFSA
jgi:hypothetical protein